MERGAYVQLVRLGGSATCYELLGEPGPRITWWSRIGGGAVVIHVTDLVAWTPAVDATGVHIGVVDDEAGFVYAVPPMLNVRRGDEVALIPLTNSVVGGVMSPDRTRVASGF